MVEMSTHMETARNVFEDFDEDGTGRLDKDEFATAIRAIGFDAPRHELDAIFEQMDSDASGMVSC